MTKFCKISSGILYRMLAFLRIGYITLWLVCVPLAFRLPGMKRSCKVLVREGGYDMETLYLRIYLSFVWSV